MISRRSTFFDRALLLAWSMTERAKEWSGTGDGSIESDPRDAGIDPISEADFMFHEHAELFFEHARTPTSVPWTGTRTCVPRTRGVVL